MAKGSQAKMELFQKIMEIFPNSFMYNDKKELRINLTEEGTPIQIKVTLTTAKTPVEPTEQDELESQEIKSSNTGELNWDSAPQEIVEPTEEEKQNVARLVQSLGL